MSQFILIGLTGLARSGKDTAADMLCEKYNLKRVAFAAPLKEAAAILLDRTLEEVSTGPRDEVMPEYGFTIREFLQKLGTESIRRVFREDFWIVRARASIERARDEGAAGVVLTDVRFDNEAMMVVANGGAVIEVKRPGIQQMNHASENGVSPELIWKTVNNDSSLLEFRDRLLVTVGHFSGLKSLA